MHTKINSTQFGARDSVYLATLLMVAMGIGTYLICTTVLISKDGVTFIEYAQNLTDSFTNTVRSNDQHPGYPFLIFVGQKMANRISEGTSLSGWIYSAQIVTLACRLLALAAIYFIGKILVGPRQSFWAVLILICLPKPAGYGSDALSDWPHLLFLTTGFLALLAGATNEHWWCFALAGLLAGMGYLIRPECAQLVVYGVLWLGLRLLWQKPAAKRAQTLFAIAILLLSFALMAGPYMKFKGGIFPKKHVGEFASSAVWSNAPNTTESNIGGNCYTAGFAAPAILQAFGKFAENIGSTLMWFFAPALALGLYARLRDRRWHEPEKVFVTGLIMLNIALMIWLHCKHGYMSQRHTLPLMVCTIFYIPAGVEIVSGWLHERFQGISNGRWFMVLMAIGIAVCTAKLFVPPNHDRQSYKAAAQWLAANTDKNDVIAVPDLRISFYAQRKGLKYENEAVPQDVQYVVRVFKPRAKSDLSEKTSPQENLVFSAATGSDNPVVTVYRSMK